MGYRVAQEKEGYIAVKIARKAGLTRSTGRLEKKKALTTAAAFCHSSSSWNESNKVFDLKSKQQVQDRATGRGNNQKMLKENNTKEGGAYHRGLKVSYLISKRSAAFHIQQRCLKSSSMQWVWCKRALQTLHCEAHFDCAEA